MPVFNQLNTFVNIHHVVGQMSRKARQNSAMHTLYIIRTAKKHTVKYLVAPSVCTPQRPWMVNIKVKPLENISNGFQRRNIYPKTAQSSIKMSISILMSYAITMLTNEYLSYMKIFRNYAKFRRYYFCNNYVKCGSISVIHIRSDLYTNFLMHFPPHLLCVVTVPYYSEFEVIVIQ